MVIHPAICPSLRLRAYKRRLYACLRGIKASLITREKDHRGHPEEYHSGEEWMLFCYTYHSTSLNTRDALQLQPSFGREEEGYVG